MDDYEFERRMEDVDRRRDYGGSSGGGGDIFSDLIDDFLPIIIVIGLVLGLLGWLDSQFGWGILDWIMSLVNR